MPRIPMQRDTWVIAPKRYAVIRSKADSPDIWLLHCNVEMTHYSWVDSGRRRGTPSITAVAKDQPGHGGDM